MAKRTNSRSLNSKIRDIQELDKTFNTLIKDNSNTINGTGKSDDLNDIVNAYNDLITRDAYSYNTQKSVTQNTYSYMANVLVGKPLTPAELKDPKKMKEIDSQNRSKMEKMFSNGDMQVAGYFMTQSSDMFHLIDEIESICAYMYQLDEAINVLRDNVLNNEQTVTDLPFDITFDGVDSDKAADYKKVVVDAWVSTGMKQKLNDHIAPLAMKYGKYYVLSIPYSQIGVKMLDTDVNRTQSLFNFGGNGYTDIGLGESTEESIVDEAYIECDKNIDTLLESLFEDPSIDIGSLGDKETIKHNIEYNLRNIFISEEPTPPNVTGVSESVFNSLTSDLKKEVEDAIKRNDKLFNASANAKRKTSSDKEFTDGTIDTSTIDSIQGCFIQLVDPRQIVPIKIFDHTLGYYYFEHYNYTRGHSNITDVLSGRMNFNDQNMVIDNIVGTILRKLKYGDILRANDDFKSMVLNCILYAERRNNPVRIKFVPVEYVTEFKTNCDPNGNGQPVLLKSLMYARLYVSLLLFNVTTIVTKSTDTEFYYLREGSLASSYQDQVAEIIEQMRNSNIDISSILNGNLLHGNRAINKRYFMSTGTQDIKPFDVEVVSGQQIDLHNDFLTDLKKMAIGSTGIPSVAVDYMDEVEFATILKMTNTKVLNRANNIQTDLNGDRNDGITGLTIKMVRYNNPNAIPEEDLVKCRCVLRKNNTINNNVSSDEINNNMATVDNMIEVFYGGGNTETPPDVEFEKEEMKKRLVMLMSRSLPWGEMERIQREVKIAAIEKKLRNQIKSSANNNED